MLFECQLYSIGCNQLIYYYICILAKNFHISKLAKVVIRCLTYQSITNIFNTETYKVICMFRKRTDDQWLKAFKDFSEISSDDDVEITIFGGAVDWPRELIETVRDLFVSTRPELATRIDNRLKQPCHY